MDKIEMFPNSQCEMLPIMTNIEKNWYKHSLPIPSQDLC